jgi:periplasmic divalent cation tolerance protein
MTKSRSGKFVVVLVTCRSQREASRIASAIVSQRLAACVNVLATPVRSVYRWKGKVERASETLLLMKTSSTRLVSLQAQIERLHSYDTPEFVVLPIVSGSPRYLAWIEECLH